MVVSCPACQTRYHYRDSPPRGGRARCGRCGNVVPLVEAPARVVVRARVAPVAQPQPRAAAAAIGTRSATATATAALASPDLFSPTDGLGEFGVLASDFPVHQPEPTVVGPADPRSSDALAVVPTLAPRPRAGDNAFATGARRVPAPAPVRARRRSASAGAVVQLLALVSFAAGLGAAGHFAEVYAWLPPIEIHPMVDPVRPVMVGGLIGVLLGWIVVRWISRSR
ncbi:MAG TPA: zinc-ribbon domain-containing protein [Candidatus Polarisedimenticolaceae bacterium]|nr:zinc-ribbon domain-containing protein [Candidatus Polarisedimenticolaceae bacterium]